MRDWIECELGSILVLNYGCGLPEKKRIPGEHPVYGSNGIVGYHNQALVPQSGIVVGRKGSGGAVHFSRKPFCPIDTTFYVTQQDTPLDIGFLYYLLLHVDLQRLVTGVGVPGLNRELAYRQKTLHPESKSEQRRIASVLSTVQEAMQQQERLIELMQELKRALMQKLLTEGLRGEKQKTTEIGPVPESWEIVGLGDLIEIAHGYGFKSEYFTHSGAIVLTPGNFKLDGGLYWGGRTKYTTETYSKELVLECGDLVVVMTDLTPTAKLLGTPAFIPGGRLILHNQRIGKVILTSDRTCLDFLYWVFLSPRFKRHMVLTATGSTVRHTSPSRIQDYQFALPKPDEQREMAEMLRTIDHKSELLHAKQATLTELFRTLLHQLMTAQIRVNGPEFDFLEEPRG